ncbi:uncharacterized protein DC041_0002450, partial [Schistosoma bovis]
TFLESDSKRYSTYYIHSKAAGDMDLIERYLNMRVKLGLHNDPEKVLKDMRGAGLTPNSVGSVYQLLLAYAPRCWIQAQSLHFFPDFTRLRESRVSVNCSHGLWPSKFAYEGLLSAYADIGDKDSLLRTLDEAYAVLPSIDDKTASREISPILLLDLYTRLVCSLAYTDATCSEITTKLLTTDYFPLEFAIDTVKVLLAKGRPAAALEIFKDYKALEPFWHTANVDSKELFMLRNKCKLWHAIKDHEINKALVFGYVFNNLVSIQSTDDLKSRLTSCLELVNEYRAKELLPYNDVVRLGNPIIVKLVTNIISVSDMAEIAKLNKSTVMHDVFRIFSHTLTKRSLRMLYLQVFEALMLSNLRSFHGIPKNIVIQLVADVCAHQNVTFGYGDWILSGLKDAGVPRVRFAHMNNNNYMHILVICHFLKPFSDLSVVLFGGRTSNAVRKNKNDGSLANQMKLPSEESVPIAAESLVKALKDDPKKLETELKSIEALWSLQKKFILLSYLVNLGSKDLVERVLQFLPEEQRKQREPMKSLAHIIKSSLENDTEKESSSESVKQSIQNLQNLSPKDLYSTMRGPHLDTLFRCWPTEHISDLIDITKKLSKLGLNSVNLQLAGVLVNRGLSDLVSTLLENNKTVPFTFLVGNPRNSLTKSEFLSSVEYLKSVDSQHIPGFVDHCLRNAALSTNDDNLYQLIRTVVSPPFNMDLLQVCIQPTLQVLHHRLEVSENLPEDILQATQPVVQKISALKAKASN